MSLLPELVLVPQTATETPSARVALSEKNWDLGVDALTRKSWLASDRSWRPSRDSRPGCWRRDRFRFEADRAGRPAGFPKRRFMGCSFVNRDGFAVRIPGGVALRVGV